MDCINGSLDDQEEEFTSREYANMILYYGEADCNAELALEIYKERRPKARHPKNPKVILDAYNRLRKNLRLVPSTNEIGSEDSDSETAPIATLKSSVAPEPIAKKIKLGNQNQKLGDRLKFCEWLIKKQKRKGGFTQHVLWTDTAVLNPRGMSNRHKFYPAHFDSYPVEKWSIRIWAAILNKKIYGPYIIPKDLTIDKYCEFIRETLPSIKEDLPLNIYNELWFAHDSAKWHKSVLVSREIEKLFSDQWIGPCGVIIFPNESPELMPTQFIWDYVYERVYEDLCVCEEEMQEKIVDAFRSLNKTCEEDPELLVHVFEDCVSKAWSYVKERRRFSDSD
ncbi:jg6811 [Pararge aegeria aegeria]|uniref:Jg6811 protein n=1 Tax=Pararge aegeria aegeria TaxID=348720 RepID=A0A8S4RMA8_9NEOP|nr:jg6811 [Pararge aegeria aegeria]